MMISGHKSRAVFDRYNIVDKRDLIAAGERLEHYLQSQSERLKDKSRTSEPPPPEVEAPRIKGTKSERTLLN